MFSHHFVLPIPASLSWGAADLSHNLGERFHLMGCDKQLRAGMVGKGSCADNPSISPRQQLKCLAVGNIKQGEKCQNSAKNSETATYQRKFFFWIFFFLFNSDLPAPSGSSINVM